VNPAEQALRALTPAELAAHLRDQRWFGARGEPITGAHLLEIAPLPGAAEPAVLGRVRLRFADGAAADYQVPLALDPDAPADAPRLRDALQRPELRRQLARAFARGAELPTADGDAAWVFAPLAVPDELDELPSRPGAGEQSNTSIVFGERAILKIYRRLEPGPHPEVETCEFLARVGFRGTPPLLGVLRLRTAAGDEIVAGMLQAFVPRAADGWRHVLAALGERAGRCDDPGTLEREIEDLGRLTARLHAALASDPDDPEFAPRPTQDADLRRWRAAADARLSAALARLAAHELAPGAAPFTPEVAALARDLVGRASALRGRLAAPLDPAALGPQIRHHGDYHLGQVLRGADGWHIIDFEGEPARPLHERRARNHPLRDVAGMLRSFAYAAAVASPPGAPAADGERGLRTAFLRGYDPALADDPQRLGLLTLFEAERLFYELLYELGSRPDWAWIPLRGLAELAT